MIMIDVMTIPDQKIHQSCIENKLDNVRADGSQPKYTTLKLNQQFLNQGYRHVVIVILFFPSRSMTHISTAKHA